MGRPIWQLVLLIDMNASMNPALDSRMNPAQWRLPLMHNNIVRADLDCLIEYLSQDDPRLTNGPKVEEFEKAWSNWLGVESSVVLNSGSSANDLAILALSHLKGVGEVVVSPLGWVSDIASIIHAGCKPVFVDIDLATLAPSVSAIEKAITRETKAALLVHILGLAALTQEHIELFESLDTVELIEDVCESHGATVGLKKAGSFGWMSCFSFYYAHHLTTIEGGAVCTNDMEVYETLRMLRAHGLVREVKDSAVRASIVESHKDLNPEFIFQYAAHNMRPTEIQGVLGLAQLARLDENNKARTRNLMRFLEQLDEKRFYTNFATEGSSNYAFIIILREPDTRLRDAMENKMRENGIEFRRGLSGGGNQLRQPYLRRLYPDLEPKDFPNVEHVHNYGWYVGNFPDLQVQEIDWLCEVLQSPVN